MCLENKKYLEKRLDEKTMCEGLFLTSWEFLFRYVDSHIFVHSSSKDLKNAWRLAKHPSQLASVLATKTKGFYPEFKVGYANEETLMYQPYMGRRLT